MARQADKHREAPIRVLVVDDDAYLRESLCGILCDAGYETEEASTGHGAIDAMVGWAPDLILLDLKLENSRLSGMDVLRRATADDPDCPVIIISGEGTIRIAVEATQMGAYDFLEKPVSRERILLTVRNALDKVYLQRERDRLRQEAGAAYRMIGSSAAVRDIYDLIDRASRTNSKVLITGESGSGKELVAHAIHQKSNRVEAPFVVVNSAAFPEELVESELFGYKKGAFTGADRNHPGKFTQADEGTLFLDEVGDMTLKTQSKILRVLETGLVTPVGGRTSQPVDVRLIAATNKHLPEEVRAGRFRRDLYYRLNVIHIHVPPLRERREDIPALIEYFLLYFWKEEGLSLKQMTSDAQALMATHSWPGNIRELRNMIERLIVLSDGETITEDTVAQGLESFETVSTDPYDSTAQLSPSILPLQDALARYERSCILQALIANDWKRQDTADALGINRTYLWRKMQRYRIEEP